MFVFCINLYFLFVFCIIVYFQYPYHISSRFLIMQTSVHPSVLFCIFFLSVRVWVCMMCFVLCVCVYRFVFPFHFAKFVYVPILGCVIIAIAFYLARVGHVVTLTAIRHLCPINFSKNTCNQLNLANINDKRSASTRMFTADSKDLWIMSRSYRTFVPALCSSRSCCLPLPTVLFIEMVLISHMLHLHFEI